MFSRIEESDEDASACTAKTSSKDYQQQLVVQKLQSQWSIYCTLVSNIPSIIVNITIVSYSDIYLAPLLGTMLKSVLCAFEPFSIFYYQYFYQRFAIY
jgi:hypothetical protein